MRKFINISLLILTLTLVVAMSVYCIHDHFNDNLKDVNLTISRNVDKGFIDYEETYKMIMDICDTANNQQIKNIPVDSVVNGLMAIPWVTDAKASINLKTYLDVEIEECEPIARVYNKKRQSVYVDNEGNMFPVSEKYVPHLLVVSGIDFPIKEYGNVNDEIYSESELPETFALINDVLDNDYAKCCVKQIYHDENKKYIFSMNNTNIIVIFGDVNDVGGKLLKMKHFFDRMLGNPELDNYKEINLNYKDQVVCTKIKK